MVSSPVWIVANPNAGGGQAPAKAARLARMLDGIGTRIVVSPSASHAAWVATRAVAQGVGVVIACGGDGTVHYVHGPLAGSSTALAILPAGSGDDIAACVGAWRDEDQLASGIRRGELRRRSVDVGHVSCDTGEESTYLGVLSVGFDSNVNERANRLPRMAGQRYRWAMLRELAAFTPVAFTVTGDRNSFEGAAALMAVGNGDRYGGGMLVCAGAAIDDGVLNATILRSMPRRTFVRLFPKVYSGDHLRQPEVISLQGTNFRVDAPGQVVYADGERIGPAPATVSVRPGVLDVLVPNS